MAAKWLIFCGAFDSARLTQFVYHHLKGCLVSVDPQLIFFGDVIPYSWALRGVTKHTTDTSESKHIPSYQVVADQLQAIGWQIFHLQWLSRFSLFNNFIFYFLLYFSMIMLLRVKPNWFRVDYIINILYLFSNFFLLVRNWLRIRQPFSAIGAIFVYYLS